MKLLKTFVGIAALTAIAANAFADVTLKKGTDVKLRFEQKMSSKTAKKGDMVKMSVVNNISVGSHVVLAKGTTVWGKITDVDKKGSFGKNAKLQLVFNPVKSTTGTMIALQPRQQGKLIGGKKSDQAAAASGAGALVLGPIGLLGGVFVEGKSVNVKVGDTMETEVKEDTVVR